MFGSFMGVLVVLVIVFLVVGIVTGNLFYVVKQQHAVIIERLGSTASWARASTPRSRSWTARRPP